MTLLVKDEKAIKKENIKQKTEEKEYKSIDEHIDYLKNNKKIIVSEEYKKVFEERNYASIINPYKELFANGRDNNKNHIYKNNVDFEELIKLMQMDEAFSKLMYAYIGRFEMRFRTLLFEELCKDYIDCECPDKFCTSYLKEIEDYLINNGETPKFCPNINKNITKKGFVDNFADEESRKELLKKIYFIGTGKLLDETNIDLQNKSNKKGVSNTIIRHYIKTYNNVPLWIIASGLTLGEFKHIYSMADIKIQKKIACIFLNAENKNPNTHQIISRFSGHLELIRKLRNIVNHYEPVFSFLVDNCTKGKPKEMQIYKTLKLLEDNYNKSILNISHKKKDVYVNICTQNTKQRKALKIIEDFLKPIDNF